MYFRAHTVVRQMRGGTHAELVNTDGGFYVVKWKQNPVHRRVLINSLVGSELLRHMDIPAPDWALIYADADLCDRRSRIRDFRVGLHFGLRRVDNSARSVYDLLPHALSHRIVNRADFIRAMVFDCWVDNSRRRQTIFTRLNTNYHAQMIGNGNILGYRCGSWSFSARPEVHLPLPVPTSVYLSATAATRIEATIAQIKQIASPVLNATSRLIPDDWLESDRSELSSVFEKLLQRTVLLPGMTEMWLAQLRQWGNRY